MLTYTIPPQNKTNQKSMKDDGWVDNKEDKAKKTTTKKSTKK